MRDVQFRAKSKVGSPERLKGETMIIRILAAPNDASSKRNPTNSSFITDSKLLGDNEKLRGGE